MSTEPESTPAATNAAGTKGAPRRGRNDQKSPRHYRPFPTYTMQKRIKRGTEAFKRYSGVTRLSPEQRDMVAYLSMTLNSHSRDREDG